MIWIPPTGKWEIRKDSIGDGAYGAPRVKWVDGKKIEYKHKGIDFRGVPTDIAIASIDDMVIERIAYPYTDYFDLRGFIWSCSWAEGRCFYINPFNNLIGKKLKIGQPIGILEDVRIKYGDRVDTHCHWQFDGINGMVVT